MFPYSSRPSWARGGSWAHRVWPWIPQWLPPGSPQSDRWRTHLPHGHAQALDWVQSAIPGRTGESSQSRPRYVDGTCSPRFIAYEQNLGQFHRFINILNDHSSSMKFFFFFNYHANSQLILLNLWPCEVPRKLILAISLLYFYF